MSKKKNPTPIEETLDLVIRRLDAEDERCIDVETTGLDWRRNFPVGYVVTFSPDPQDSYYLPFWHGGGGNIGSGRAVSPTERRGQQHPGERALVKAINRPGTKNFGHNFGFDLKMMLAGSNMGTIDFKCEDTQVNACLINEWQGRFDLEYCCKLAGVQAKKGEVMYEHIMTKFPEVRQEVGRRTKNSMGHYWRLAGDDPVAVDYAVGDGTSTWQLRDWQALQIAEQELDRVHDVESRLIPTLVRMTMRGVRVDEEYLDWLIQHLEDEIEGLMAKFPDGFSARSPKAVREWMEKHGCTDWPLTPTGKPSFPEVFLEKSEPGQAIIKVRKFTNLRDSFAVPLRDHHMFNGRVNAEFHQLRGDEYGTITGRLSCSGPNLQQVPKRNKVLGRLFRRAFIPDEGKLWGSRDYEQCEPRLLAYYSGCKVLMDGYMAEPPVDAHQSVADALGRDRELGKRINQTLLTGGGAGVLTERYGIPTPEAREAFREYFAAMPEIKDLQNAASRSMKRYGYVFSLLGRRARLLDRNKAYVAVNRLLQCGNADILKLKMVEIDEYLQSLGPDPGVDLMVNVHDALESQFDPKRREVYEECGRIMTNFSEGQPIYLDGLKLPVDGGEGTNWAVATWGEEKK